jgi:hypothetical protein
MAKPLSQIEAALLNAFSDITIQSLYRQQQETVVAFMDFPDMEEQRKRPFPAISIELESMDFQVDMEHSLHEDQIEYDPVAQTIRSRKQSHWYRLCYRIHSWALYAEEDRELMRKIENRFAPRDSLTVGDESYWIFREDFFTADEIENDRKIYHKVWTFDILADIDNDENDTTTRVVEEIHLRSYTVKNRQDKGQLVPVNDQGVATTADQAVRTLHREIRYDDTSFWFPS